MAHRVIQTSKRLAAERQYDAAGLYKMYLGRSAEGVKDTETALRLDPHNASASDWQAHLCYLRALLAQWEQAIEQCEKAAAANPEASDNHKGSLTGLAAAYAWAGLDKEAKEAAAQLRKLDPNWMQVLQTSMNATDDPTFKAEVAHVIGGLRKAGLPEE